MSRMSNSAGIALALIAAVGLSSGAGAAVKFKSVQINTTSSTSAIVGGVTTSQSKTLAASGKTTPVIPLTASSSAVTVGKIGAQTAVTARANGTVTTGFTSAGAGTFNAVSNNTLVQPIGSTRAVPIHGVAASSSYTLTYRFENTGRAKLLLNYLLFDPAAVASSRVTASLGGGAGGFTQVLLPNTSGSIAATIFGGTYSLILRSVAMDKITRAYQAAGTSTGQSSDSFSFSIAAVPEPATWISMILGFGAIGFALRRRRGVRAVLAA